MPNQGVNCSCMCLKTRFLRGRGAYGWLLSEVVAVVAEVSACGGSGDAAAPACALRARADAGAGPRGNTGPLLLWMRSSLSFPVILNTSPSSPQGSSPSFHTADANASERSLPRVARENRGDGSHGQVPTLRVLQSCRRPGGA